MHPNIHGIWGEPEKMGISLAPKVKNPLTNSNNHEKMRKTQQHYFGKSNVTPVNDVWLWKWAQSCLREHIAYCQALGGKNINFNTNNLDYLNFGLKWEQSFLEWKISEIRVYLCKFYYSAICTMEVSWILIDNPEVYFVFKTSLWMG